MPPMIACARKATWRWMRSGRAAPFFSHMINNAPLLPPVSTVLADEDEERGKVNAKAFHEFMIERVGLP